MPRSIRDADDELAIAHQCASVLTDLPATQDGEPFDDEICSAMIDALDEAGIDLTTALVATPGPDDDDIVWTPAMLRLALQQHATQHETTFAAVLERAMLAVNDLIDRSSSRRNDTLTEIDRMRRERLLPDALTLHVLTRHESHLHRMYMMPLRELQAAQFRRRAAASAPVAAEASVRQLREA